MVSLPPGRALLAVIDTQNEIAATAMDLDAATALVCRRATELTGAAEATLELVGAGDLDRLEARPPTGARSVLRAPVICGGATVGCLTAFDAQPDRFADDDVATLCLLAEVIAAQMARAAASENVEAIAVRDPLTGLGSPHAYDEVLAAEVARHARYSHTLGLVLLDLDDFAGINARHGAAAGDALLQTVGAVLRGLRTPDQAFRIGGAGFAVLLPGTDAAGAAVVARRVVDAIEWTAPGGMPVTVSVGFVEAHGPDAARLHAGAEARLRKLQATRRPLVA